MFERFTEGARAALAQADQEARRLGHEFVGTEHLLLGLIREGSGVAATVLEDAGVDRRRVQREVERIVQHGPGGRQVATAPPPHTPRAKKVIEYSIVEARDLDHNYVGIEHLLLGLLREQEGVAAQVLMNLGLKLKVVREDVTRLLGVAAPAGRPGRKAWWRFWG